MSFTGQPVAVPAGPLASRNVHLAPMASVGRVVPILGTTRRIGTQGFGSVAWRVVLGVLHGTTRRGVHYAYFHVAPKASCRTGCPYLRDDTSHRHTGLRLCRMAGCPYLRDDTSRGAFRPLRSRPLWSEDAGRVFPTCRVDPSRRHTQRLFGAVAWRVFPYTDGTSRVPVTNLVTDAGRVAPILGATRRVDTQRLFGAVAWRVIHHWD